MISLTIPPRNTSDAAYRARIEAKRQENARHRAIEAAVIAAETRTTRTPRPAPSARPCTNPECGRLTRPKGARAEDWPGTLSRQTGGLCGRCHKQKMRDRAKGATA